MISKALRIIVKLALLGWRIPLFFYIYVRLSSILNPYVQKQSYKICRVILQLIKISGTNTIWISGTGRLIAFGKSYCLYFPMGKLSCTSLERSISSYEQLSHSHSGLQHLVDYSYSKVVDPVPHYRCDTLMVPNHDTSPAAHIPILASLSKLGHSDRAPTGLFSNALDNLRPLVSAHVHSFWLSRVATLAKHRWNIGPLHGDLTRENIMINTIGQLVFIDLDRFCWKGIQDFDCIHFEIERWCKNHQTDWFIFMDKFLFPKEYGHRREPLPFTFDKKSDRSIEKYFDMYFLLRVFLEGSRVDLDLVPASWLEKVAKHAEARVPARGRSTIERGG